MGTSEMPIAEIGGVRVIVLQGAYNGMVGTCLETCPTELQLFHATLEPNRNATFEVPSGWNAVLYVINGSGLVNGEEMKSCRRTGKYDAPGKSTCKLSVDDSSYKPNERREFSVSSDRESMEVMFFAGKPIGLPMIWFDINEDGSSGTFVSSDVSEIKDWLEDWTRGINGFEYRDHWISPGMQKIRAMWNGDEKPAQDRPEPISERIGGDDIKQLRRQSIDLVDKLRAMNIAEYEEQ